MQKRKKLFSTVCIVLVIVMIASLLLGAFGGAMAVSQAEINALKNQQTTVQQQKKDLQSKITNLQGEMDSVVEQKTALDEQNELARQEIELINEQIDLYDKLIEEKARELEEAKADEAEQKEALRVRMRAMEESGSLTYFAILFEANDFSDLLSRLDFISGIMKYDKKLEEAYIAARQHVEEVKAEYEATQEEQKATRIELEQKKAELEKEITAAEAVIDNLENDIEKYKQEFAANEAAEKELSSQINDLVAALEKQQKEQAAAGGNPSYITGTGSFQWPVPGHTASNTYGWRFHPIFKENRFHAGEDIGAPSGTSILAADSGTVAVAAYSSSYGNYVVISHGNGISTLYAHMSSMAVSVGASVTKGQVIGYVGSTGWSTGPHLHFEVRVNGSHTDPLSYTYS
ncbi:MAG: peptidoglycan DD-metalloendopeptidase family protein [Clostridiales bacterium]|jgi:murein DD-endopeptidase MepM/ murein hydrolase activator NlpD|nr:peptidoglycan DD-metalloendopeptidase family protein [Clostridiales bacterium]